MSTLTVRLDHNRLERILTGGVSAVVPSTVLRVHGPGALDCLQGILSNDLVGPGPGRLIYNAVLTPKGMIVSDMWVLREAKDLIIIAPRSAHDPLGELFSRTLPPRLAAIEDLSRAWTVRALMGDLAEVALAETGLTESAGEPGAATTTAILGATVAVAYGTPAAPFKALLAGPHESVEQVTSVLGDHGVTTGSSDDWHAARIVGGWPALGLEIGSKTLPQEVRFEDLDGVSFTKGCFIGQETVARVHFRGRTQRELRGVDWRDLQPLEGTAIANGERTLGEIHSVLELPDRRVALGMVRREAAIGDTVTAGGREARIVALPLDLADQVA